MLTAALPRSPRHQPSHWLGLLLLGSLLMTSCQSLQREAAPPPRHLQIQQTWTLQPGKTIGDRAIVAGLGDISIALNGGTVYAPFSGEVQPATVDHCFVFSSAEVPAYLFRLCGLKRARLGQIEAGQRIGTGDYLHFAALRRQPDGTWVIVEPADDIIRLTLAPNGTSATAETTAPAAVERL